MSKKKKSTRSAVFTLRIKKSWLNTVQDLGFSIIIHIFWMRKFISYRTLFDEAASSKRLPARYENIQRSRH